MGVQTYFLGSNSANGFHSLYDQFCPPEGNNFLWVIKGGPGCGKSSFMRKIGRAAEEKGYNVEYVLCSGDPDSLDGVYIPQLGLGYVDGTAPHVLDVPYPGAHGSYLDLGQFYDIERLKDRKTEITDIHKTYKGIYERAYKILAEIPSPSTEKTEIQCKKMFHTAVSCKGILCLKPHEKAETVSISELKCITDFQNKYDIAYMHPLWPNIITGFYSNIDEKYYETDIPVPNCENAVSHLKKAKELHDELEKIYNPNVNFDGVYNLADQHIRNYL